VRLSHRDVLRLYESPNFPLKRSVPA
jgi:hypothetical protein